MRIRPVGNYVLISPRSGRTETSGGILLPDSAQEKVYEGEVLAIGPGRVDRKGLWHLPNVNVGDQVLYHQYAETVEVEDPDLGTLLLVPGDDMRAVLD